MPRTVSVVIPTRNAGPGLSPVLEAIRSQRDVGELELIVVDSESGDGTVDTARSAGARVIQAAADAFNHGRTRERAVEASSGDVVFMTVQDAVLVGEHAIRDLTLELAGDERLAAVGARHIPRSNSDLFGAYSLWLHESAMAEGRARPAGAQARTAIERRADASLDNVCSVIRREAWAEVRFRDLRYGEDLDFGLRAVELGWRIGRSRRVAVVHSHARDAAYHLRRHVVDRLIVPILVNESRRGAFLASPGEIAAAASDVVGELAAAIRAAVDTPDVELDDFLADVSTRLEAKPDAAPVDAELRDLVALLGSPDEADGRVADTLRARVAAALRSKPVVVWSGRQRAVKVEDGRAFVARLAATALGATLGDAIRFTGANSPLATRLTAGI